MKKKMKKQRNGFIYLRSESHVSFRTGVQNKYFTTQMFQIFFFIPFAQYIETRIKNRFSQLLLYSVIR